MTAFDASAIDADILRAAQEAVHWLVERAAGLQSATLERRQLEHQEQLRAVIQGAWLTPLSMEMTAVPEPGSDHTWSCWAEAIVYLDPAGLDRAWEPDEEPACWKIAVRHSDEQGLRHGLTVIGWHRENYEDTVYETRGHGEPELLGFALANVMHRECMTAKQREEHDDRYWNRPANELVDALIRVLKPAFGQS